MVLEIIVCLIFCALSEFLTYKFIKRIDKKERKKLQLWEDEFVEKMKPEIDIINNKYLEFLKNKEKASALEKSDKK